MDDIGKNLIYKQEVTSTNDLAKDIAKRADSHGTVIIAQKQTKARGRLGRIWNSNNDDGVWMSVILKSSCMSFPLQRVTLVLAVSVCQTLNEIAGVQCEIKWPNDILLDSKKICGILCESQFVGSKSQYVIAGIGINVNQDFFEDELKEIATSLKIYTCKENKKDDIINELVIRLNENYKLINGKKWDEMLGFYKSKCSTLGKVVKVASLDPNIHYKAMDINESGNLLVSDSLGKVEQIVSDEVFEIKN